MTHQSDPGSLAGAMLAVPGRASGDRTDPAWAIFNNGAEDLRITHDAVVDQARRLAAGLASLGLSRGDVFAVQMPTRPATMVAHAAAALLGLTLLPIIHIYQGAELDFILGQSGAKALLTPRSWRAIDFAARRAEVRRVFPDLLHVVEGGGEGEDIVFEALLEHDPLAEPVPVAPDDIAMLMYTSGTTSQPKGVQHSHSGLLWELLCDNRKRGELITLSPWPPGHVAGVLGLLRFWAMGQSAVFMEAWDGQVAARLIEQYRVQGTGGTPFHITTLLDAVEAGGRDISSLRDYMAGATMIPPALIRRCQQVGLATYRCYGLSEHPTISTGSPDDPLEKRLGTDGRLNENVEVRIVDDEGNDLPPGEAGEIWSRGPDRFVGYRDASRNSEALTGDGWLKTGDVGVLDADGYLSITDRKKDIIIRGGENIASREVEDLLSLIPGVRDSAVVGAPDPLLGERIAAFVVADPDAAISLESVAAHFSARQVARQKTPEFIHLVDDLPRNSAGKVLKPELRARLRG